ncbi:unnamed protein product [Brachionus calyciflorus]|uniref:Uncharacterized protein n=1 Tax=Brachionus calyciflorus TaxID=104777 RepID=A0A814L340_9BILA|nr:unnamed protein product [Brachionus calyciflorus]
MGLAKVFEDEQNKLFKTLLTSCDKDILASLIPKFQSLKHGLQKHRNRTHEQYPTSLGTTGVEGKYTKTSNGLDKFLIYTTKKIENWILFKNWS